METMLSAASDSHKQRLILGTRLSEVLGRLSMPCKGDDVAALDREYKELLKEIRRLAHWERHT